MTTAKIDKSNIRILVVDDEAGMRDMLKYELGMQGFTVSTASDGAEAVEMVGKSKFDLVISDVKMPKLDGVAALEQIKKIDPGIEVIMATGFGTIETAVNAMKKGAYDFIQKPFNLEEVGALIEKALEKSELKALVALYESSKLLFSTVKLGDLLNVVMDLIQKVLRADEGSLMLLSPQNNLTIAANIGIKKQVADEVYLEIGERVAGRSAAERREFLLIDGFKNHPEFRDIGVNSRIGSSIVIPLVCQDELVGVLNVNRLVGRDNFNPSDLRNASIFASQVAQAVRNAKLYEELEVKIEELRAAYKMLEETRDNLVESEKLASIGKLVAGVAHELNNPLTSVIGYTELLLQSEIKEDAKEQLTTVYKEAERCRRIIQDLLIFARHREPIFEEVNLAQLAQETIQSLALEIKKNQVQISQKFSSHPPAYGDACQLRQVFMNILKNAIHALSETSEKKITIALSSDSPDLVRVVFTDNGSGISKQNLSKIFDPFFSTKDVGKGTGLGLSLSYGIMKQHGGNLSAKSEAGGGAAFIVELPLKKPKNVKAELVSKEPNLASQISGKSILVVEDEESIRNYLRRVLSMYHLVVETASDADEALSKLNERDFDIVLTDFRLPKMDGVQLFEKVKAVKPAQAGRFVFMTGDTEKTLNDFFVKNQVLYIMKPFRPDELISLLQKVASHEK